MDLSEEELQRTEAMIAAGALVSLPAMGALDAVQAHEMDQETPKNMGPVHPEHVEAQHAHAEAQHANDRQANDAGGDDAGGDDAGGDDAGGDDAGGDDDGGAVLSEPPTQLSGNRQRASPNRLEDLLRARARLMEKAVS
jgi:hypothetical protein